MGVVKLKPPLEKDIQAEILSLCPKFPGARRVAKSGRLMRSAVPVPMIAPPFYLRRANTTSFWCDKTKRRVDVGTPGQCDLTGEILDGPRLECEVKRPGGKLTPDQEVYHDAMRLMGVRVFTTDSAEDFIAQMRVILKGFGLRWI